MTSKTTIQISKELRKELNRMKRERETFEMLLKRKLNLKKKMKGVFE